MPRREPDGAVEVLHADAELVIVNKPPGLPTTAPREARGVRRRCLVDVVAGLDPGAPRLHPTSRLDAPVSGVVTFARTPGATRALLEARRRGAYRRVYLGVAARAPIPGEGSWDWAIDLDPGDRRLRRALGPGDAGRAPRPALTDYRVAARADAGPALLALRPHTGRTHQLRVHAARAGAPLLGDAAYGGPPRVVLADGRVVTARRVLLHCAAVSVPDVAGGGAPLVVRAPIPGDLATVWAGLGGAPIRPPDP